MEHKVKVTVLDKKLYPELQQCYCANPCAGACDLYNVGDEYIFENQGDFMNMGLNTLVKTTAENPKLLAGGGERTHCAEMWDALGRYIYSGLQGGSIMRGWMKEENTMIACCNDGTRPVIFKIERIDRE